MDYLHDLFDPKDMSLIRAMRLGDTDKPDLLGWHYNKSGKYTVKSGYHLEQMTKAKDSHGVIYGPDIRPLQAFTWKLKCSPKLKHFIWQLLIGCVSVAANLRKRGINCDSRCSRCGAEEETINHVIFECPPALQVWALSNIPTVPGIFPSSSLFTNLDFLFWRFPTGAQMASFPWIIWYVWKARNDNIFSNLDRDPRDTLQLAENEALAWEQAQNGIIRQVPSCNSQDMEEISESEYRCFIDGSWKESDIFSGIGWFYSRMNNNEALMGACNLHRRLSSLHTEVESLIWAMRCLKAHQKTEVSFLTDCSELVKMVSTPKEWLAFSTYLEEIEKMKGSFSNFSLSLVSRRTNVKADSLARNARVQPQQIMHVNTFPPAWISESF